MPELTAQNVMLKIKTFGIRHAAELARVKKSEGSGAGLYDIYVSKLLWFTQAHSSLLGFFIFHERQCLQRILFQ